jgi:hypothetical protein
MDWKGGPLLGHFAWPYSALKLFFWGYIKAAVYVSQLATTLPELAGTIRDAVAAGALDLLNNVWTETEHRYDIWWALMMPPLTMII